MKKKVLVDISIRCEPSSWVGRHARTMEQMAKEYEAWCKEFEDFVRDHRSQDAVYLTIERKYSDQCSFCHNVWEEDEEGPLCCQEAMDEWTKEHERT